MMKAVVAILFALWGIVPGLGLAQEPNAAASRFVVVDVLLDSAAERLAAYQLEVAATNGVAKIVGIEGGDPAAFRAAPYYDPAAIQSERVVLGAFSVAGPERLPQGRVRIASIHCQVSGGVSPRFTSRLVTAATSSGRPIPIRIEVKERNPL